MTDTEARDLFIKSVRTFIGNGRGKQPFGDFYDTASGEPQEFRARPVVGGHFALVRYAATMSTVGVSGLM